jgi:glutathione S-transferase
MEAGNREWLMKLYDAAWAPSPRRVRIYLAEKGISVERVAIDLRSDAQRSDAYLRVNPRGTVPALVLDDGEVIDESVSICRYFEAIHPEPPLFGRDPAEIARIDAWSRRIESDGYGATVNVFRNRAPAFAGRGLAGNWPPVPQISALVERGLLMWGHFLDALDGQLRTREWIAGDAYSFADVTGLVTIDFARAAKMAGAEERPAVMRWHAAASARPSAME